MSTIKIYVLTGEGERWRDRGSWTMHAVLGVFASCQAALAAVPADWDLAEDALLVTAAATGDRYRVKRGDAGEAVLDTTSCVPEMVPPLG